MSRCSDCGDDTEHGNRLCRHCAKVRRAEAQEPPSLGEMVQAVRENERRAAVMTRDIVLDGR